MNTDDHESIGVIDPSFIRGTEGALTLFKQQALFFNRLTSPFANQIIKKGQFRINPEAANELKWLFEEGILCDLAIDEKINIESAEQFSLVKASTDSFIKIVSELRRSGSPYEKDILTTDEDKRETFFETMYASAIAGKEVNLDFSEELKAQVSLATSYITRLGSIALRGHGMDSYPVLPSIPISPSLPSDSRTNVIQITVRALPLPDDRTPWEQILEFRSDPSSYGKFLDLRNWMGEVARAKYSPKEIKEKLEYLMSQYQRHLELHKLKTNAGVMETVVVSSAEFIEDFVHVKWGKIAKGLFSFRQKKIAMLEGELTSPGHEVAYLVKAKEVFSR